MECNQVTDSLAAYLDGEVTQTERAEIEAHLAVCPDCRRELASLKKSQDDLRRALKSRASDVTPPPQSWSQLELGIEGQRPSFLFLFRKRKWRIVASVIVVVILVTLGILWLTGVLPGVR